jgi:hypothetical protein
MGEILQFIVSFCGFLYERYSFRFVDSEVSATFGNAALYLASPDLELRFVRDRGQLFLDFRSVHLASTRPETWYSFDVVRRLVTGQKIWNALMNEESAAVLRDHMDDILRLFAADQAEGTVADLRKLERLRAKEVFG